MSLLKLSPWLARFIIAAAACLFALISFKFVLDPQHAAASSGLAIDSAVGATNTRAGFGGFPLGIATILVFCLFSARTLLPALASIATIAVVILMVRAYGAAQDGTYAESLHLLIPEAVISVAAFLGAVVESAAAPSTRRQAEPSRKPQARPRRGSGPGQQGRQQHRENSEIRLAKNKPIPDRPEIGAHLVSFNLQSKLICPSVSSAKPPPLSDRLMRKTHHFDPRMIIPSRIGATHSR